MKGMEGSLPDTGRKEVLAPEKAGSDVKENTKEIQRQQEERTKEKYSVSISAKTERELMNNTDFTKTWCMPQTLKL